MMEWKEEDRRIFEYPSHDGGTKLFADPLAVRRKLLARSAGKIDELVDKYRLANETSQAIASGQIKDAHPGIFVEGSSAEEEIALAVAHAFDLQPFNPQDGSGATEKYCLRLLDWFNEWREQKKTSGENMPNSSPDTDSLPEHALYHTTHLSDLSGIQVG